tara:strand:- start:77 stop:346 length:270 start_codon:yes stop_codon:yes gene_type:complete
LKTFILKLLVSILFVYLLFEFTIGKRIDYLQNQIKEIKNKENREEIKNKILEELEKANKKENILEERERKIISTFIEKINKELTSEKSK